MSETKSGMLKHKLTQDMLTAMKEKDVNKKAVLSIVKANIQKMEIELKRPLTAEEELTILSREHKQIKDSLEAFGKAQRMDLVEKETAKLAIVESYMPKQMTEDEVIALIEEAVKSEPNKQFGAHMGALSKRLKGQFDGNRLSQLLKRYF